jgi:hypothetical protein
MSFEIEVTETKTTVYAIEVPESSKCGNYTQAKAELARAIDSVGLSTFTGDSTKSIVDYELTIDGLDIEDCYIDIG